MVWANHQRVSATRSTASGSLASIRSSASSRSCMPWLRLAWASTPRPQSRRDLRRSLTLAGGGVGSRTTRRRRSPTTGGAVVDTVREAPPRCCTLVRPAPRAQPVRPHRLLLRGFSCSRGSRGERWGLWPLGRYLEPPPPLSPPGLPPGWLSEAGAAVVGGSVVGGAVVGGSVVGGSVEVGATPALAGGAVEAVVGLSCGAPGMELAGATFVVLVASASWSCWAISSETTTLLP